MESESVALMFHSHYRVAHELTFLAIFGMECKVKLVHFFIIKECLVVIMSVRTEGACLTRSLSAVRSERKMVACAPAPTIGVIGTCSSSVAAVMAS